MWREERGSAILEYCMVLPIIAVIFLAIIGSTRYLYAVMSVEDAGSAIAHAVVAEQPTTPAELLLIASDAASVEATQIDAAALDVSIDSQSTTPISYTHHYPNGDGTFTTHPKSTYAHEYVLVVEAEMEAATALEKAIAAFGGATDTYTVTTKRTVSIDHTVDGDDVTEGTPW